MDKIKCLVSARWVKPRRPLCSETPNTKLQCQASFHPRSFAALSGPGALSQQVEGCALFPPSPLPGGQVLHLRWAMMAWSPSYAAFPCLEGTTLIIAVLQTSSFQHHLLLVWITHPRFARYCPVTAFGKYFKKAKCLFSQLGPEP